MSIICYLHWLTVQCQYFLWGIEIHLFPGPHGQRRFSSRSHYHSHTVTVHNAKRDFGDVSWRFYSEVRNPTIETENNS